LTSLERDLTWLMHDLDKSNSEIVLREARSWRSRSGSTEASYQAEASNRPRVSAMCMA
jgi:hypothetical protein